MKNFIHSTVAAVLCGAVTFGVIFFLIPTVAVGVPDFVWITANIVLACAAAFFIFEKLIPTKPLYILAAPIFELVLILIFAEHAADSVGINLDSAFGGFEFAGFALPWIFGATAAQLITLLISKKLCKGKELNR